MKKIYVCYEPDGKPVCAHLDPNSDCPVCLEYEKKQREQFEKGEINYITFLEENEIILY